MAYNSPDKIVDKIRTAAKVKKAYSIPKFLVLALMGGAYIAIGSMVAVIVAGGMPGVAATDPGIVKLVFGALFPLGFILVTFAGAELFTSTTAVTAVSLYSKEMKLSEVLRVWAVSYGGNFIGALIVVYLLGNYTHVFSKELYQNFIFSIAEHKLENSFLVTVVKGIGANWLVCLAAWLTYSSKDVIGKLVALWFPVMAFVALGFEHSVANMFFIPLAKSFGADISWFEFLSKNLIPATLGNIIGGAFFVGLGYWFVFGEKKSSD